MRLSELVQTAQSITRGQMQKRNFYMGDGLIGVNFLIAVVSIIQGMNVYMEDQFANRLVGLNTFSLHQRPDIVTGGVTEDEWRSWFRRPRITDADARYVREHVTVPATFAMFCSDRQMLTYDGRQAKDIQLMGTEETYFRIKNVDIAGGRAFSEQEVRTGQPVLVIGDLIAEKLFAGVDPLGKEVAIMGLPYRVIGVATKQGTLFGLSMDKFAVMPC